MEIISNEFIENEVSLRDIIKKIKGSYWYFKKQLWKLILVSTIGGAIGFLFALNSPITYKAKLSFVVEEGKLSNFAGLAGQFGFDIGSSSTGLFTGDNLLLFLNSNSLIKQTLLTPYDSLGNYSLADKYSEIYKLREKWVKSNSIKKEIFFPSNSKNLPSRIQDSLLQTIVFRIQKDLMKVERPEKKASFVYIQVETEDEVLSSLFCQRLLANATERYIQSKTRRQKNNVVRLQLKADSINNLLNNQTYFNAKKQEQTLDINPAERTSTVGLEVSGRDKTMMGIIYGEVVKNLEIAKVQLTQETPTIQIVDYPEYPLTKTKTSKIKYTIIFSFIAGFLMFIFYGFKSESSKNQKV
jgi:hypothetical protein